MHIVLDPGQVTSYCRCHVTPVPCRIPKFSGVHCVDLHIPTNFGADSTKIHFIGFKGEFTGVGRRLCFPEAVRLL